MPQLEYLWEVFGEAHFLYLLILVIDAFILPTHTWCWGTWKARTPPTASSVSPSSFCCYNMALLTGQKVEERGILPCRKDLLFVSCTGSYSVCVVSPS